MTESTSSRSQRLLVKPLLVNLLLALVAPLAVLGALELSLALFGVQPVLYEEDPYVGFSSRVPLYVAEADLDGPAHMVTAPNKLRLFNAQRFPREKDSGVYRIFCLGGSTTFGRPYDDITSFCGWLRELLPLVEPGVRWEVVNAGGVSYASYRSAIVMEELNAYEPDLFIVYSGHNEFLEDRTYGRVIATPRALRGLGGLASRTRTFAAMRSVYRGLRSDEDETRDEASLLDEEVRTRLDDAVGPDAYHRDEAQRQRILEHYRFNLARMVDIARSAGADVVLIRPASNLRDSSPFKSEFAAGLEPRELRLFDELLAAARNHLEEARPGPGLAELDRALEIDDRHALAHYLRGRALDQLGRTAEARAAFARARDEDVCPLRAPGELAEIVPWVASRQGVPMVDFERLAREWAVEGIAGADLFFDHVHPRVEVHRRLALELLGALADLGAVPRPPTLSERDLLAARERIESGLDREAHGQALINLSKVLGWAGKLEEALELARQAIEISPDLAEGHYQAGVCAQLLERSDEAIAHYRRSVELAPSAATAHGNLAIALEERGRILLAVQHYRQALRLVGEAPSPYRERLLEALARLGATPD